MTVPAFIAGDWGTSNLTLALCDEGGHALETRKGPGAANSRGRFAEVFDEHVGHESLSTCAARRAGATAQ